MKQRYVMTEDQIATFWSSVDKSGECWIWTGRVDRNGYGVVVGGEKAHRQGYYLQEGSIDDSLTVDHLCSVKLCVRREHLELVTLVENVRRGWDRIRQLGTKVERKRKTHCKYGHDLSDAYMMKSGYRNCRPCALKRGAEKYASLSPEQKAKLSEITAERYRQKHPGSRRNKPRKAKVAS